MYRDDTTLIETSIHCLDKIHEGMQIDDKTMIEAGLNGFNNLEALGQGAVPPCSDYGLLEKIHEGMSVDNTTLVERYAAP